MVEGHVQPDVLMMGPPLEDPPLLLLLPLLDEPPPPSSPLEEPPSSAEDPLLPPPLEEPPPPELLLLPCDPASESDVDEPEHATEATTHTTISTPTANRRIGLLQDDGTLAS